MPTLSIYSLNNKPETQPLRRADTSRGERKETGRLGNGGGKGSWIISLTPITPKLMPYIHGFKWPKSRLNQRGAEKRLLAAVVTP